MLDVAYSELAKADLKRLARYRRDYAAEVLRIVREELRVDGRVSDAYAPHILNNPNGHYSGYMEFHAFDDVLVLYYPPFPHDFVRIQRVCTHAELHDGVFGAEWPHS
ncbi:type II toxin-antitoxin system YafQ family toxin [Bifidobacterium vespertilionis]|uniref:type II toxin-antitoxin system YafQ family toxin n=1 Tax=Bifidobacterium vespertilionis TaxID=2562524 RepID=UPI001BDC6474|nr:type II toxin-antitoxin system YafQ family toxin [Bifidobacterium vespertilionis]MBT1179549.1 type II toxin-antitoxin system YafQ family toxin [Bifidobacterium vespertilionis]